MLAGPGLRVGAREPRRRSGFPRSGQQVGLEGEQPDDVTGVEPLAGLSVDDIAGDERGVGVESLERAQSRVVHLGGDSDFCGGDGVLPVEKLVTRDTGLEIGVRVTSASVPAPLELRLARGGPQPQGELVDGLGVRLQERPPPWTARHRPVHSSRSQAEARPERSAARADLFWACRPRSWSRTCSCLEA